MVDVVTPILWEQDWSCSNSTQWYGNTKEGDRNWALRKRYNLIGENRWRKSIIDRRACMKVWKGESMPCLACNCAAWTQGNEGFWDWKVKLGQVVKGTYCWGIWILGCRQYSTLLLKSQAKMIREAIQQNAKSSLLSPTTLVQILALPSTKKISVSQFLSLWNRDDIATAQLLCDLSNLYVLCI